MHAIAYDGDAKNLAKKYLKAKENGEVGNVEDFLKKKQNIKLRADKLGLAGIGVMQFLIY